MVGASNSRLQFLVAFYLLSARHPLTDNIFYQVEVTLKPRNLDRATLTQVDMEALSIAPYNGHLVVSDFKKLQSPVASKDSVFVESHPSE